MINEKMDINSLLGSLRIIDESDSLIKYFKAIYTVIYRLIN